MAGAEPVPRMQQEIDDKGEIEDSIRLRRYGSTRRKTRNRCKEYASSTLWVGGIDEWMDETQLMLLFAAEADNIVAVKLIRDRVSLVPLGYAFLEFSDTATAARVLELYNGQAIPGRFDKFFRLNWAQFSVRDTRLDSRQVFSAFVGDLDSEVDDHLLESLFRKRFGSVTCASVVRDKNKPSNRHKGYGFVRFSNRDDCEKAIDVMNGVVLLSRAIRVSHATPRRRSRSSHSRSSRHSSRYDSHHPMQSEGDDNDDNTTIFVGGLDASTSAEQLHSHFRPCGLVTSVRTPLGKGCGFVHFQERSSAERALRELNGLEIGGSRVRLSWGHTPMQRFHPTVLPPPAYYPLPYEADDDTDTDVYSLSCMTYTAAAEAAAYGLPMLPLPFYAHQQQEIPFGLGDIVYTSPPFYPMQMAYTPDATSYTRAAPPEATAAPAAAERGEELSCTEYANRSSE